MESPIKWAGGKTLLVPEVKKWITDYLQENGINDYTYVDLFCGSLAIPLNLDSDRMLFNDRNRSLIHMYHVIKTAPEELLQILTELNDNRYNNAEEFNRIRQLYNDEKHQETLSTTHAAHFIYLNKRSFNGLYRENSSGNYNVPYREYKSGIFNASTIRNLHSFLNQRDVVLTSDNYEAILDRIPENSIVYIDPPYYPVEGKSQFVAYTRHGFSIADQERLCEHIKNLDRRGIKFIMSNTPCPEIRKMYEGFYQESFLITRSMRSAKGKTRSNDEYNEILITNLKHASEYEMQ